MADHCNRLTYVSFFYDTGPITPGGLGSSSSGTVKPQDPSIDLELDVRVCISSGMCNLYTRCISREEEKRLVEHRFSWIRKEY